MTALEHLAARQRAMGPKRRGGIAAALFSPILWGCASNVIFDPEPLPVNSENFREVLQLDDMLPWPFTVDNVKLYCRRQLGGPREAIVIAEDTDGRLKAWPLNVVARDAGWIDIEPELDPILKAPLPLHGDFTVGLLVDRAIGLCPLL